MNKAMRFVQPMPETIRRWVFFLPDYIVTDLEDICGFENFQALNLG